MPSTSHPVISDPRFNRAQAAHYLGVSPATLEIWATTGRYNLPYIKVGRLVQYRKSHLDAWLERRTHNGHGNAEGNL